MIGKYKNILYVKDEIDTTIFDTKMSVSYFSFHNED